MLRFINSSVNYSETNVLKNKHLSPILESYNEYCLVNQDDKTSIDTPLMFMIPNNRVKYYMFIVDKQAITHNSTNSKYKSCYFFPSQYNKQENKHTDFYVEIDNDKTMFPRCNYLFEGYMYNKTYLITDVLAIDSEVIKCDYSLRYSLVHKIIAQQDLDNVNGHLHIGIHSMFQFHDENHTNQLFNIFKANFLFRDDISAIELVYEKTLKKNQKHISQNCTLNKHIKRISKTKYVDVYDVYNIDTNDNENILYVKTISDSVKLREMMHNVGSVELMCSYNNTFHKWQPILA